MDDVHFSGWAVQADLAGLGEVASLPRIGTVGFIGNCQAELLQRAFRDLAPQYASFYHFFDVPAVARDAARRHLADCDVLLMQDIQDLELYQLRDAIGPRTKIVEFPFLRFAALWPYDDFNGIRDSVARAQDDPAHHTTIYYDGALGRLRRTIADPQARFEAYRALDVHGLIDPLRVLDFEARRLAALDARFDCTIGRFILDEFRHRPLFYTVNRPNGLLLRMLMAFIFERLDLDLTLPSVADLDELGAIRVPIHPKVAERLDLAWIGATWPEKSDWETHVRGYIARYG